MKKHLFLLSCISLFALSGYTQQNVLAKSLRFTVNPLLVNTSKKQLLSIDSTTGKTVRTGMYLSSLENAISTNTINNAGFTQEWQWPSLNGSGLKLTSTGGSSGLNRMIDISLSGVNTGISKDSRGIEVSATTTGTNAYNYGVVGSANNGLVNIGLSGSAGSTSTGSNIYASTGVVGQSSHLTAGIGVYGVGRTGVYALGATGGGYSIYALANGAPFGIYDSVYTLTTSTKYGIYSVAAGPGTGDNIAGYFKAQSGSGANYSIIVPSGGGNVGLGISAPTRQLEVLNDAAIGLNGVYTTAGLLGTVAGDGVAYMGDYDEVNNGVKIKVDDGAGEITMTATDTYITSRLNQQGQVSIGRSATYGLGVIYVEHAVGGARVYMGDFDGNNNSTNIYVNDADGEIVMFSNGGYILNGSNVRMGNYGAGTATFDALGNISSVSDIRLKNVSATYTAGLSHLKQIKPIVFKWNELSGMEMQHDYIGFSAQNINETLGDGATGINKDGYLSIQDRAIMAVMVNSINELSAKVEKLEKEVKRLKRK